MEGRGREELGMLKFPRELLRLLFSRILDEWQVSWLSVKRRW